MRELYIEEPLSGKIRLTRTAHERYGRRFARVGYDVRGIKTLAEFEQAVDAMISFELNQLARETSDDSQLKEAMKGLPGWD